MRAAPWQPGQSSSVGLPPSLGPGEQFAASSFFDAKGPKAVDVRREEALARPSHDCE